MLTDEQCRSLLESESKLDDDGLSELKIQLYSLARQILDRWMNPSSTNAGLVVNESSNPHNGGGNGTGFGRFLEQIETEHAEAILERAAMIEIEGERPQNEAEVLSIESYLDRKSGVSDND